MTDVHTKEQRSFNMSRIRGKNTSPEIKLREALHANGMRGYRLHYKLLGKPDIVFTKARLVIFIDGCFWHKCPKCFVKPRTRVKFWEEKINSNVKRDCEITEGLTEDGWVVIRIWEHEVGENLLEIVDKIEGIIRTRER